MNQEANKDLETLIISWQRLCALFQLLIVDDEISVLDGLTLTIPWQDMDIESVHRAENGYEALEILHKHSIDIVMTDIRMPGMNGLELIRTIRKNWTSVKTIILSGHAEFEYAQGALRAEAEDFLLKPIRMEDVIRTIRQVQQKLRLEWEHDNSQQKLQAAFREHLPMLRNNVLYDLIIGKYAAKESLAQKLQLLEIPFAEGDVCFLMLIRIEEGFAAYDPNSLSLISFAIGNMMTEIFGKHFHVWGVTDSNDHLVFALKPILAELRTQVDEQENRPREEGPSVERLADQLQKHVLLYLKGKISIIVSRAGQFPGDIRKMYESNLSFMHRYIGSDLGFFFAMDSGFTDETPQTETVSLDSPYRMPTLLHLLSAAKWGEAEEKLHAMTEELQEKFAGSREHVMEVYHIIASAFAYVSHKNGRFLTGLLSRDPELTLKRHDEFHSIPQLQHWALRVLRLLRSDMENQIRNSRSSIINKVHQYVMENLSKDVSLQAIADHVHFHPVYLSKVYKLETDETLTEYLHRIRMEKAVSLLKHSNEKIYKIAQEIGIDPAYFNRVFKKHFGLSPQEYRDRA